MTSLLFPAPAPSYTIDSFPGELIWVPKGVVLDPEGSDIDSGESCESAPCLLLPYESARFLILFFHSNAEDLGRCRWFCLFLRDQFQVHVLAVEYPGYGVCPGTTSREAIMDNARAALQFATEALELSLDRVKLFGRSIGTGPTLALASKFKVSGVILVTPFLSVRALFREKVGPLAMMIEEWFSNEDAIQEVKSPVMIIHGGKDFLIPCVHGEALYNACPTRKLFINPPDMEHNTNLTSDISFLIVPMFRFFALPDYSFTELKIPAWAYDKRRSPLHVRPEVQVASHTEQVVLGTNQGATGTMSVPAGDDADAPVDQMQANAQEVEGRTRTAFGDDAPVDYEKMTMLSHPTVLHSYSATKERYHFQGLNGSYMRPNRGAPQQADPNEEVPEELINALRPRQSSSRPDLERCSALGNRDSATKPPSTSINRPPATRPPKNGGHRPPAGIRTLTRHPARGASSGMAFSQMPSAPGYDEEPPRPPQESPEFTPFLSQHHASDDEDENGCLPASTSNRLSPGPRLAQRPSPLLTGDGSPATTVSDSPLSPGLGSSSDV